MTKWISVKEKLPERAGRFLVLQTFENPVSVNGEMKRKDIPNVSNYSILNGFTSILPEVEITHWMVIPSLFDVETDISNQVSYIELKANVYQNIGKIDHAIVTLLHSVDALQKVKDELAKTSLDTETEEEIQDIIRRWISEIGMRMTMIIP